MWGGDDPDCRKPMVWQDLVYEPEVSHPFNKPRPEDEVIFNQELFEWYKKIIAVRNENPVLALGDINFFLIDNESEILGYKRNFNEDEMIIILNNKNEPTDYKLNLTEIQSDAEGFEDLIDGNEYKNENGIINLSLQPYQILILKKI